MTDLAPCRVRPDLRLRCIGPIHRGTQRRGWPMLELAILGLLQETPMHGYELRKELATKLGTIRAAISYGTLYPTLKRLQTAGWITETGGRPVDDPADDQQTRPGCLQDHCRGQGAVRRPARPGRPGDVRRRRLRGALRLLRPHRPGHPAAHPRGPPPAHRGAPRGPARRARPRRRPARRVHARTATPRTGRLRARGPLAGGAHHQRALRPRPGGTAGSLDSPPNRPGTHPPNPRVRTRTGRDEQGGKRDGLRPRRHRRCG